MGDFPDDFTNDEDLEAQHKMFDEVSSSLAPFIHSLSLQFSTDMQSNPLVVLDGHNN